MMDELERQERILMWNLSVILTLKKLEDNTATFRCKECQRTSIDGRMVTSTSDCMSFKLQPNISAKITSGH